MKKTYLLLLLSLSCLFSMAQTRMQIYFTDGSMAEYMTSQIDYIKWITDKGSTDGTETSDPSVTGDASAITNYSAVVTCYANNILDNLSNDLKVGIIYCTEGTPSKSNGQQSTISTSQVASNGEYSIKLTNLSPATTYYYRSFVYQSGLWFYGNVRSFTTAAMGVTFSTSDASSITCFSAKATGGFVVDASTTYSSLSYGICYGTTANPTTSDSKGSASSRDASGNFTVQLRALQGNTVYCYRPYVIIDGYTVYGNVRTFQTLADNVVTTGDIDTENLTVRSLLTIGGGAYSTLALGVCYGTSTEPSVSDRTVTTNEVDEENYFSVKLSNLAYGTIYYRAYVLIDGVAHYGTTKSFYHTAKHEYVDLGLPSGTLWATCNVGAFSPEDYGDYFAWGETTGYDEGKTTFSWSTYKYCNGSYDTQTRYCMSSSYGTVDNKTELDLEDDAAYVNWGKDWRMPSYDQQAELCNTSYCTCTWTTQNGVKGYKVTSVSNGNSIFLPAAGYRYDTSLDIAGSRGDYWSRSLYSDYSGYAYYLYFNSSYVDWGDYNRCYGRSVRPVRVSSQN